MLDGGRSATGGAPSTKTDSTPEEVANAALYLCSALSGNVTGFHAPQATRTPSTLNCAIP
jgi:hypothetical protein